MALPPSASSPGDPYGPRDTDSKLRGGVSVTGAGSAEEAATAQVFYPDGPTFLGHPRGLFLLFFVEMWERFSYYGMRALLILYLVANSDKVLNKDNIINPGRGWSEAEASTLYGWYTGLAYLFPIFGGMIADKLIGTHRSMLVGGLLITLGHVVLGISGLGALAENREGLSLFITGLAMIVLGTGHFKPTVSVMVGQLYRPGDPRRDGAFSIFYMGINLGAFLCPFVCGTLGEKVGWHWGFGSAAVGMLLGLLLYVWGKPRLLKGIGDKPAGGPGKPKTAPWFFLGACVISGVFGLAYQFGAIAAVGRLIQTLTETPALGWGIVAVLILGVLAWIGWFLMINRPEDRMPVVTIFVYIAFNALFWMAFEQAGSSMTLYTDKYTDTTFMGQDVPTTWFQSLNPMFIFILAPIFSILWTQLGKRKINVPQPAKIALGLIFLGLGFAVLVYGANTVKAGVTPAAVGGVVPPVMKAAMFYLVLTYFLHTVGEICLSPTGLSYVTKAAPVKFVSLLMGIWFVSSFVANLGGGLIAAQVKSIEDGKIKLPWNFGGQADFFMLFVVSSVGAGLLILALTPILVKWQRSKED